MDPNANLRRFFGDLEITNTVLRFSGSYRWNGEALNGVSFATPINHRYCDARCVKVLWI